ncbi:P-loop containing nucleoside triphosphate hydrolase protein [Panus rudis PR-1116 ss-1]|nr:P-loop containing nucleoside triphosphate hydrolase protein [Panus rudis PR-1116 ss-1]
MWTPSSSSPVAASWLSPLYTNSNGIQVVLHSYVPNGRVLALSEEEGFSNVWHNSLAIPVYASGVSLLAFGINILWSSILCKLFSHVPSTSEDDGAREEPGHSKSIRAHIDSLGGLQIFIFRIARLVSCLALLALSMISLLRDKAQDASGSSSVSLLLHLGLCIVYGYAAILAVLSVTAKPNRARSSIRHLCFVLLTAWVVFLYRDFWPFATVTLKPIDRDEAPLIWIHIAILTFAAAVVPLTIPRQYIPLNPEDPQKEPNPEQTASLLSLSTYAFLDKLVFAAYAMPHLPLDKLPPLADYDSTKNLVSRSFPHLDPFTTHRRRHIFFGLMKVFRIEYCVLGTMLALRVITTFAGPIGINRLLYYLENGGEGTNIRPWVWVSWLLLGPILGSLAVQWYIFVATGMLVRTEAIITQLVFEHGLRIRMKAEARSDMSASARSSVAPTPDTASIAERSDAADEARDDSENETVASGVGSNDGNKGKRGESSTPTASSSSTKVTEKPAESSGGGNLSGKMTNLVTTDLNNIVDGRDFLFVLLYMPFQVVLCAIFLYKVLGWSAFVGMGVTVALFPVPGFIASRLQAVQVEKMKKTDARVQTVTEVMNVIRMVKLFGWEARMNEQLAEKREQELMYQRRLKLLELANGCANFLIPCFTMLFTFGTFTLIMKQQLSASIIFPAMVAVTGVPTFFYRYPRDMLGAQAFKLKERGYRISRQLRTLPAHDSRPLVSPRTTGMSEIFCPSLPGPQDVTELLDDYAEKANPNAAPELFMRNDVDPNVIGFREASFTWSAENDGTLTPGPSKRNFTLRIEDELNFKPGHINLIVGPTGSGKTSMLMALLGEMHYIPMGPNSYYNLPRSGGVAYAAQESWVQNETIRDNILFGAPYDETRYNKVIYQCGLTRDLSLFDAGDQTEVGEKGLTLSGGQKARITLARAVYSNAQILLLDDVLAALDVHTSRWIVDKCFKGDLLRGRTVILVTHNVAMTSPIAEFVVSLGSDGRVLSQGTLSKALAKNKKLAVELKEETEEIQKHEDEIDQPDEPDVPAKSDGKLIVDEEIALGHVGWKALKLFFSAMGGRHSYMFWATFLTGMTCTPIIEVIQTWFLGYWARQYDIMPPEDVSAIHFLTLYTVQLILGNVFYITGAVVFIFGCLRASRTIHKTLTTSVLGTTLRWLDKTPTSRVITRCTKDIAAVDGPIAQNFGFIVEITTFLVVKFIAVVVITPVFLIPGLLIAGIGGWCGQIYIKSQLSVKREMSNARAPVLGHFSAAMAGLTSIRAYGAQDSFRQRAYDRIDRYTRSARTFYNLNRWICVRIETLGALYQAGLAAYLIYATKVHASDVGFSLAMAVSFSSTILWWIRMVNDFEVQGNSLERIQQYLEIEQEPKPTVDGIPPAYWPASGNLDVQKLSARYAPDGPRVLQDVTFQVNSGERVGIVGRTGSGKSSLTLALLRCILTEGTVRYDGLETDKINLDALRSNITIIPQVPELLSGSLRQNLDPFGQYDDATLNDALRAAGLFSLQSEDDESRITLDSPIASGGGNLSVGQRQILALARAIVRRSKLLILDEATSAIDYETDTIIQSSLRKELDKDVTLLTIAHRLQTIMDADKIMVLDAGKIVEFGKPSELLQNEHGFLKSLVDESGDKAALYAMAAEVPSDS